MNDPTIAAQRALPLLSELDRDLILSSAIDCEHLLRIADQYPQDLDVASGCRRSAIGQSMFAFAVAEGRA